MSVSLAVASKPTTIPTLNASRLPSKACSDANSRGRLACPGLTACAIPGVDKNEGAFEYVDVMSDLQSCGGRWGSGKGEGRSTFDRIADARCVQACVNVIQQSGLPRVSAADI